MSRKRPLRIGEDLYCGKLLYDMRVATGLLQKDVAELTGIPRSKISEYENDRHIPSVSNMQKLINLYEPSEEKLEELMVKWEVCLLLHPQASRY